MSSARLRRRDIGFLLPNDLLRPGLSVTEETHVNRCREDGTSGPTTDALIRSRKYGKRAAQERLLECRLLGLRRVALVATWEGAATLENRMLSRFYAAADHWSHSSRQGSYVRFQSSNGPGSVLHDGASESLENRKKRFSSPLSGVLDLVSRFRGCRAI